MLLPLLPQCVLHGAGQRVHRRPPVAGLTDFRLQQNILAPAGRVEAAAVSARLLLDPVGIGAGRRPAGEGPHLGGHVVQMHRGGLATAADRRSTTRWKARSAASLVAKTPTACLTKCV